MALGVVEHRISAYHSGRTCICGIRIPAFQSGPHPCDNKNSYRILTDAEVEESFNTAELDMLKRGTALVTAMGTVKLIPWKKGDKQ
jgi:hypothetical protein